MPFFKKHYSKIMHLLIWVMLLHLIFDLIGILESAVVLIRGEFIDEGLIMIPTLVALFYVNLEVLIPRYIKSSSLIKYLISLGLLMIVLLGVGSLILYSFQRLGLPSQIYLDEFFEYSPLN